ncbi:HAMP domain-containing histidine kinase [Patescibacteria group bacterium]|nr:HAMP domain-containing histidine kinase [Patescibacteria group bacterium]
MNYYHLIGLLTLLYIFFFLIRSYIKSEAVSKSKILLMGIGIIFFLSLFLATSFSASILKYLGLTENYQIELYGFFPIIIFIILLGYLTIKYKIFNIKLLATQALVFVMIIFIGSQFFFIKVFINFILNSITFVAIIIFGVLLIKSVKKEILQREEFVKLNIDLKKLIKQRQDLVHLVTHKVKGYFTRSKCVFAEMIEGSFGALPPKAKEMAMLGLDSDNEGINTIDIVLNAASLQAGLIKYDIKPIDFRKVVEQAIESKKDQAKIKGLKLETEIKDGNYILTGDKLWLKEVALNLVDNAVKYTNTGEITVGLELKEKQILFYVKDTGDGITDEDRKNLWTEGGRGKRSLLKNPNSTGYGLYLVKLIIEAHKGKVWEESAVGKGSIFYVKLPLNIKRLSDN